MSLGGLARLLLAMVLFFSWPPVISQESETSWSRTEHEGVSLLGPPVDPYVHFPVSRCAQAGVGLLSAGQLGSWGARGGVRSSFLLPILTVI